MALRDVTDRLLKRLREDPELPDPSSDKYLHPLSLKRQRRELSDREKDELNYYTDEASEIYYQKKVSMSTALTTSPAESKQLHTEELPGPPKHFIDRLPKDIVHCCLEFLDASDINSLYQVDKAVHDLFSREERAIELAKGAQSYKKQPRPSRIDNLCSGLERVQGCPRFHSVVHRICSMPTQPPRCRNSGEVG